MISTVLLVIKVVLIFSTASAGFYAAWLWARASRFNVKPAETMEDFLRAQARTQGNSANEDLELSGLLPAIRESGALNARAALWTGVTVALGAATAVIGLLPDAALSQPVIVSHSWVVGLNLISIAAGMVAALCLYWAGLTVPWKLRSYGGETPIEKRYKRTQRVMAWIGLPCLVLAGLCQTVVVVWGT